MEATSGTYAGIDKQTELNPELGRILFKILRKWQQSGQNINIRSQAAVPMDEMETVIIPAYSESIQPVSTVEDELTETVMLSPFEHGVESSGAPVSAEEVSETVIITSVSIPELPPADEINCAEVETAVPGRDGEHPQPSEEEGLDETIILPPRNELLKRKGMRQRNE